MTEQETAVVRHISVSGDLGSGKTAVSHGLAEALGWETVSTGAIQRKMAEDLRLSTLETNFLAERDKRIDTEVDAVTAQLGRDSLRPLIFDSRMAWKMVPQSLKVRLVVDPTRAAERILSRTERSEGYESYSDAFSSIEDRFSSEQRRFLARYGVDITSTKHYDLIIDTSDVGISDVVATILDKLKEKVPSRTIWVSGRYLVPVENDISQSDFSDLRDKIPVAYSRPYFALLAGHDDIAKKIEAGERIFSAEVIAEGQEEVRAGVAAADYVAEARTSSMAASWEHRFDVIRRQA